MPLHRIDPAVDQFVKHNPVVETFASALEQAVAEIVEQCYVDSKATVETLGQAVADLSNSLEKSRKVLAGSFARVRHKKVASIAERVDRLQAELNAQRSWLLETIRPQFEQPLKSLEPAGKPVLGVLERITESARQAVDTLSDEQEPPEPAPDPGEKHLLQRLNKQIIDITGMGKPPHLTLRKRASQALPTIESLQQNSMVTEHAELVARLGAKTGDLWTSLRFHLQIAGEELDLLKAEPLADRVPDFDTMLSEAEQLSLGVINSVAEQIAAQILPLQSFWGDFGERLQEYQVGFCQSLYQAVVSRESGNAGVWDNLSRSFRRHREALQQRILSHKDPHAPANFLSLGKAALAAWQESFHQEPGDQEKRLGLTDLPSNDEILKRADAFPLLYRRLFTLGPLKNHEFLVARDEELKTLDDLFKRWKDGKPCSLAVIGPEGSGKTSLVNCFAGAYGARGHLLRFEISRRLRSEQEVVDLFHQWFDIEQPTDSLDALVQQLLARPRGMVLVEGGHNLALRVVGGS
ncbi:MAG: ATP-binding protein, partial [Desulfuromonadaceae bacterium]